VAHTGGGGNWAMSSYALQTAVPDELRGRIFSVDVMTTTLAITASQLVVGAFVDHVATRVLIGCCGAVTLTYAVIWRLVTSRIQDRDNYGEVVATEGP
jgi:MFS family permease